MVGLLLAEVSYRLSDAIEWMDNTVRVIDSVGLGSHLAAYGAGLFMGCIVLTVWVKTRGNRERGLR